MLRNKKLLITTLASVLATSCFSTFSHAEAPANMPFDMTGQLATMSGSMHATAIVCQGYSEKQLIELKQQQQELLEQRGMTKADFEKVYSAAKQKTEEKWKTLTEAEQKQACEKIKQHVEAMTQ